MDLIRLRRQIERFRDRYHNMSVDGPEPPPDEVYDTLEARLRKLSPNDPLLKKVGATIKRGKKVKLPHPMPSLDKIYPDRGADKWVSAHSSITVSDKLDGISAQLKNVGGEYSLYTRGDGKVGQDISALIPRITFGTLRDGEAVRVELQMPRGSFDKNWAKKYANPRNLVSGIVNSANPKAPELKDIVAIAHGMLNPKRSLRNSAAYMKSRGFVVVPHKTFNSPTIKKLQDYLTERKNASKFELDGLVLEDGPDQISFKVNSEAKEATVKEVKWILSKNKRLIPVVHFTRAVQLSGVSVTHPTGHNAKFIKDNGIGPGAVVYVVRAGDVIPKIVGVKKKVKPEFPKGAKWDATKTHLIGNVATQVEKNSVYTRKLSEALRILGVPQIREGLVSKLVEAGYTNLLSLFKAGDEDFQAAGLGPTQADLLYTGLQEAKQRATHSTMMWASGKFPHGMGASRFDAINKHIPYERMRKATDRGLFRMILAIPGFSDITANQFVSGFNKYVQFVTKLRWRPRVTKRVSDDSLTGVSVVFTGVRNKKVEDVIRARGGKVSGSISKNTTVLVIKDSSFLTKVKGVKAKLLGVKTMTLDKFAASYGIQL